MKSLFRTIVILCLTTGYLFATTNEQAPDIYHYKYFCDLQKLDDVAREINYEGGIAKYYADNKLDYIDGSISLLNPNYRKANIFYYRECFNVNYYQELFKLGFKVSVKHMVWARNILADYSYGRNQRDIEILAITDALMNQFFIQEMSDEEKLREFYYMMRYGCGSGRGPNLALDFYNIIKADKKLITDKVKIKALGMMNPQSCLRTPYIVEQHCRDAKNQVIKDLL